MLSRLAALGQPLLLTLPPEVAHETTLRALELGLHPHTGDTGNERLGIRVMGLEFPNPLGIAAGFDKDARVPDALLGLGMGFAECGTLTPRPQAGNPRPRVFRLIPDRALINRLGFNNGGHEAALARLARRPAHEGRGGIVGINIGANKDTSDRAADYVAGLHAFYDVASYFMINISSPNTPGLRDLQAPQALDELLGRLMAARAVLVAAGRPRRPLAVKLAPDIAEEDLGPIVARLVSHGVDAIAISNTTLARDGLTDARLAGQAGGVSGRPVFERSTRMLARAFQLTGGKVPLIGIGGIDSGAAALAKIEAGASLIQLYTGLIYEGAGLIGRIKAHLADTIAAAGLAGLGPLIGRKSASKD